MLARSQPASGERAERHLARAPVGLEEHIELGERLGAELVEGGLDQLGDPYKRIGLDEAGRVGIDFGVYGVPETYVIDKTGRIRLRFVGPLTAEALNKELLPLIKELGRS